MSSISARLRFVTVACAAVLALCAGRAATHDWDDEDQDGLDGCVTDRRPAYFKGGMD